MVSCPECGSQQCIKDGKVNNKQTYLCKCCFRRFVLNPSKRHHTIEKRKQAISLYQQGNSIRAIATSLGIPFTTVAYWIKKYH